MHIDLECVPRARRDLRGGAALRGPADAAARLLRRGGGQARLPQPHRLRAPGRRKALLLFLLLFRLLLVLLAVVVAGGGGGGI